MRLPIHAGYEVEPTKAVAVPIYQTVAYAFDSAAHGAALFNLEVEGYRCRRIANPTCDVLERRVAAREGGFGINGMPLGNRPGIYAQRAAAQTTRGLKINWPTVSCIARCARARGAGIPSGHARVLSRSLWYPQQNACCHLPRVRTFCQDTRFQRHPR